MRGHYILSISIYSLYRLLRSSMEIFPFITSLRTAPRLWPSRTTGGSYRYTRSFSTVAKPGRSGTLVLFRLFRDIRGYRNRFHNIRQAQARSKSTHSNSWLPACNCFCRWSQTPRAHRKKGATVNSSLWIFGATTIAHRRQRLNFFRKEHGLYQNTAFAGDKGN